MPPSPRLGLPEPAEADTPDIPRDLNALIAKLDEATAGGVSQGVAWYMQGTLANRPAAGVRGRFYWATDTALLYRDDGAAWTVLNPATGQTFIDAPGDAFQEGIIDEPGLFGGVVTRLDPVTVRIASGAAWINGDSIAGFGSGRYKVTWPQTDITGIPATGAAPANRLDQFIVQLTGSQFSGTCSVQRLAGAEQAAGTTLDLRAGAAALPAGSMRLADVLMDATGVPVTSSTNTRDRRPWARGASYRYENSADGDVNNGSATYVDVDSTKMSPRLEIAQGNDVVVDWDGVAISAGGAAALLFITFAAGSGAVAVPNTAMRTGNRITNFPSSVDEWDAEFHKSSSWTLTTGGSMLIKAQLNSAGGATETVKRAGGYPTMFRVTEIIRQSNNNGMGA